MRMPVQHLVAGLQDWEDGPGPLSVRLADALCGLVQTGALATGDSLPSERALAQTLGVSRNTVTAAYSRLSDAGWLVLRRGAVPRVGAATGVAADNPLAELFGSRGRVMLDLTIASPAAAPSVLALLARPATLLPGLDELTAGTGYHPAGHPDLLRAVARKLQQDGIDAHPDEIVITNGAQQALSLVADALHRPQRPVAVEALTYPGVLDVVTRRARDRLVALPVNGTEPRGDAAARLIRAAAPAVAYLTNFHNPTGAALDLPAAQTLLAAASTAGTPLVEDRTLADLSLRDDSIPPPLASLDSSAAVVTIGSLSKLFWGGLRIGWIHTNRTLAAHLRQRRRAVDLGGPTPIHLLAATLLDDHLEHTRRWRTSTLTASLHALTRAIDDADLGWRYTQPAGGPSLWVRLPHPSARTFATRAARDGTPVIAGDAFAARPNGPADTIRIPYYHPAAELADAAAHLAATWKRHVQTGHR